MPIERIPLSEHAARRRKVLTALRGGVGLIHAGVPGANSHDGWRPHPHFEYATGITDEPGALLLLDPSNPVASRRECLFLAPLNRERERWDGYRMEIGGSLRERYGIEAIYRSDALPRMLTPAAARSRRLCCLHPFAAYNQPVSPDLEVFRRVAERIPGTVIEDRTHVLATMRAAKSRNEIGLIQRAVDITAAGYEAAFAAIRPGRSEFDVQAALEQAYVAHGARGPAYGTIAGAGLNSTVLHYRANVGPLEEGDLICIDSAAAFGGYGADVTRTLPVSGVFTKRQREIYQIVLRAEEAAIRAVKPGITLARLDDVARGVIVAAGHGDAFIHGTGHHLGLETHDITPEAPLRAGAVITIEPGIYLPEEKLGVRIEDDVLVTAKGARVLSAKIPKAVDAIEKRLAQ